MNDSYSKILLSIAVISGLLGIWYVTDQDRRASSEFARLGVTQELLLSRDSMRVPASSIIGTVELQFDFGNGERRRFEGSIVKGMTLLDTLYGAAEAGKIEVVINGNKLASIGGLKNEKSQAWSIYRNKKKISTNAWGVPVLDKDEVLLKYE